MIYILSLNLNLNNGNLRHRSPESRRQIIKQAVNANMADLLRCFATFE